MSTLNPSVLAQFTATERYYRLNRLCLLTDGTKYLAECAGAFWLMDAAASYLIELGTDDWFVQVVLTVTGSRAVLTLEDSNPRQQQLQHLQQMLHPQLAALNLCSLLQQTATVQMQKMTLKLCRLCARKCVKDS